MTSDETRKLVAWLRVQTSQCEAAAVLCSEPFGGQDDAAETLEDADRYTQAADALEAGLPQEREGRCWCDGDMPPLEPTEDEPIVWCRHSKWGVVTVHTADYCQYCGAQVKRGQRIARRNADVARVERVRDEVARFRSNAAAETTIANATSELMRETICEAIEAALDGGGQDE